MTITDQKYYWSYFEITVLFPHYTERQVREKLAEAGLRPAGKRPPKGRGRSPVVFDADAVVDILAA